MGVSSRSDGAFLLNSAGANSTANEGFGDTWAAVSSALFPLGARKRLRVTVSVIIRPHHARRARPERLLIRRSR